VRTVHGVKGVLDEIVRRAHGVGMARSLQAQIWAAFEEADLTFDELSEKAGLELDRASMSRKLRGKQKMWTVECERIARVLGIEVSTGKKAA
jgi:hypothetical protein